MMSRLSFALILVLLAGCASNAAPDLGDDQRSKAVRNRVVAGLEYLKKGDPSAARRHLIRAVELDDSSAEAHNALSLLYKYEGDVEREEYHLKKALRADSNFGPARNNYGTYFLDRGDLDNALKQFKKASNITSYTGRGVAYENMGRVYLSQGEQDKAMDAFNKAMRLNPEGTVALLEMADLYLARDNTEMARRFYEQYSKKVNSQSARGLWVGIRVMALTGDRDAQASYELALQNLYPKSRELQQWKEWRQNKGGS